MGFNGPDVLPGVPQRDGHEVAGISVGQQVAAFESLLSLSRWKLLLGEADEAVESGVVWAAMTRANTRISFGLSVISGCFSFPETVP